MTLEFSVESTLPALGGGSPPSVPHHAQRLHEIGLLVGEVSHDYHNMLTAIIGYSSLLRAQVDPGDSRLALVEGILETAGKASLLSQRLLALSRRETGGLVPTDLNALFQGMSPFLGRLLGDSHELHVRHPPDPIPIMAVQCEIEQLIMNLVVNARDAMPKGGPISMTLDLLDEPGPGSGPRMAFITIRDSGIGMGQETLAHIFEPFITTKGPGRGTGLGLSTVREIVEQHRGTIRVSTRPGTGSTFEVRLPL